VRSSIIKALHRRASRDADKITIETIGSKVLLGGTVHSLQKKRTPLQPRGQYQVFSGLENNIEWNRKFCFFKNPAMEDYDR